MLRVLIYLLCVCFTWTPLEAKENLNKETHVHIEDGVVYCDVQTFNQEAYVLNVLAGGSSLTVFWQFDVLRKQRFWLDKSVASVRLGRQVIPDLVTKRWLMRDLSSGVVHYTRNVHVAMRFLTEMHHAAVVDVSILDGQEKFYLETQLYIYEGEQGSKGWFADILGGVDMGTVELVLPAQGLKHE
ncbi:DUF4390 domain-containing protein [Ghiorsea bivora]|uniref:DUF4390 domain-containing protein n=1 Tax=Ghiorsea bivora TaxID=1485545 RepID=UPI0005711732|nr:DUF4390 domain-containing protein [Ghiorsea bivora]